MFVLARISLFAIVFFLADGEDNSQLAKKILNGIKPTTTDLRKMYRYTWRGSSGFKQALDSNDKFLDFGQQFIANLTDFGGNLTMINDKVFV